MRNVLIWDIYYGDRFVWFPASFTAERKELEKNPLYTPAMIEARMERIKECKIGITSDLRGRKNTLSYKENTLIHKTIRFEGTYAQALKVESDLRFTIEQTYKYQVDHRGNDHFYCHNLNIMKAISRHFDAWVEEAMAAAGVERV